MILLDKNTIMWYTLIVSEKVSLRCYHRKQPQESNLLRAVFYLFGFCVQNNFFDLDFVDSDIQSISDRPRYPLLSSHIIM